MIRWLRVVWPPGWALAFALFIYAGFEGFCLLAEGTIGIPYYGLGVEAARLNVGIMGAILAVYAIYRVLAFHPCYRPDYTRWLATTVWSARKPLPLGPIHLVWQDALLAALGVGLCWPRAQHEALFVLLAFAVAYVACLAVANGGTGEKHWSYVLVFWFGVMALLWTNRWAFAASVIASYGLVYAGMRRSLRRFPWEDCPNIFSQAHLDRNKNKCLGWPFDHLGPRFADLVEVKQTDALVVGGLAGWWFFVISCLFRNSNEYSSRGAFILCTILIFFGSASRIGRYCVNYYPPIAAEGRPFPWFIIPGYDQIFVAPFAAICVGLWIAELPGWVGFDPFYAYPWALAAACWILLGMGPSLKTWRLTGNHRIVPGVLTDQEAR